MQAQQKCKSGIASFIVKVPNDYLPLVVYEDEPRDISLVGSKIERCQ
jgi:hypothetical protein